MSINYNEPYFLEHPVDDSKHFSLNVAFFKAFSIECDRTDIGSDTSALNFVFFPKILKYFGLWPFSVFPRCQCVYTHQAGRTPALQQNWQSSEKSQHFREKTKYLMNTLYIIHIM